MKEILMFCSTLIGGLFMGLLAGLLGFFVWSLIKEAIEEPKKMFIPALFLLTIFGTALAYLIGVIFQNWPLLIGSALSFIYVVYTLFKGEQQVDGKMN